MSDPDNDAGGAASPGGVAGSPAPQARVAAVEIEVSPQLVEKPWGGHRLDLSGTRRIGESWLYVPGGTHASMVATGDGGRPRRIDEVLVRPPRVLVKVLDCEEELSLQVHRTKWEGWLALASLPGAQITSGLADGASIEELRERLVPGASDSLRSLLRPLRLGVGDFLANPPGTLHAIGGGHLILEVQSPEDETLRLSDWDRGGSQPRALHVTDGLAAIDPGLRPAALPAASSTRRIVTPEFTLELPGSGSHHARITGPGWKMFVDCENRSAPTLQLWCEPSLFAHKSSQGENR